MRVSVGGESKSEFVRCTSGGGHGEEADVDLLVCENVEMKT